MEMEQTTQERCGRCNFGSSGFDAPESQRAMLRWNISTISSSTGVQKPPGHHPEWCALWSLPTSSILWLTPWKYFPKLWIYERQAFISGIPHFLTGWWLHPQLLMYNFISIIPTKLRTAAQSRFTSSCCRTLAVLWVSPAQLSPLLLG